MPISPSNYSICQIQGVLAAEPFLVAKLAANASGKVVQPDLPFFRPIIAAAKNNVGWLFAWPSEGGIEVTEVGHERDEARPIVQSPLLSSSTGGTGLNFNEKADTVILTQQRVWGQPVRLWVWDVGSARQTEIANLTDKQAAELACKIAAFDPQGAVLTDWEKRLYDLTADPGCPQVP